MAKEKVRQQDKQSFNNDFEILDIEDYPDEGDQQFSHQLLVMRVMNKLVEAGIKEMREGYFNEKADRFGNIVKTYIEDTRKSFIETVKTAMMFMDCDYDEEAKKNIKKILEDLQNTYNNLVEIEKKDFEIAPLTLKNVRRLNGIFFREKSLNKQLPYYQEYLEEEVEAYRKIATELNTLTARLNFYQEIALKG